MLHGLRLSLTLAFFLITASLSSVSYSHESYKLYKGDYIWGAEVNVFQECHSDNVYWVSASSSVLGPLLDFYNQSTREPYDSIYIEFRGLLLDEELDGFAEQYDGLIRISETLRMEREIPGSCK